MHGYYGAIKVSLASSKAKEGEEREERKELSGGKKKKKEIDYCDWLSAKWSRHNMTRNENIPTRKVAFL